ncbi:MAG: hypothetical protein Q8N05_02655 [Bacteroidota bacterium]|nr:hypothetical protein [Bacteroidota bacterium]
MEKNETLQKINNKTILIKDGRLVGLGTNGRNSIDVVALDDLLSYFDKQDIIEVLTNTITGIGQIYSVLANNTEGPINEFCDLWIRVPLPDNSDIYSLGNGTY